RRGDRRLLGGPVVDRGVSGPHGLRWSEPTDVGLHGRPCRHSRCTGGALRGNGATGPPIDLSEAAPTPHHEPNRHVKAGSGVCGAPPAALRLDFVKDFTKSGCWTRAVRSSPDDSSWVAP